MPDRVGVLGVARARHERRTKDHGIITLALISAGSLAPESDPPLWVIVSAGLAISLGTYLGGWRVIRTLGTKLTEISTTQGFAAETSSSAVILASSHFGFPLSTTHVASGSIIGSGVGRRLAEVHWNVAGKMALGWLVTLPAAALVGAGVALGADAIGGTGGVLIMAVIAAVFAGGIFFAAHRDPVNHNKVNDRDDAERPLATAGKAR